MSLTFYASAYRSSELEALLWGLLDGDGYRVKDRKAVELRTHSWIEAVQSCWIARKLYGVSGVTRYDGAMKIRWSSAEMWRLWGSEWLNDIAKYRPLPYLVGLFYAEGTIQHFLRVGAYRSRLGFRRLVIPCFRGSRYAERLFTALKKLGIEYSYDGERVYIYSKEWTVRILEYFAFNYRFFKYLLLKKELSLGLWVVSTALDYYVLHEMLRVREKEPLTGRTVVYPLDALEPVDVEVLRIANVRVPEMIYSTRPLDLYRYLGVGTYYDVLDLSASILEKTFGGEEISWVELVFHYADKLPTWYSELFYTIRDALEETRLTVSPELREVQRRIKTL